MGGGVSVLFDAATNLDGRLELFGLDGAGQVVHQFQWPGGTWSAWERLGRLRLVLNGALLASAARDPDVSR